MVVNTPAVVEEVSVKVSRGQPIVQPRGSRSSVTAKSPTVDPTLHRPILTHRQAPCQIWWQSDGWNGS